MDTILQFIYTRPITYIFVLIFASIILFLLIQYIFYAKNLFRIWRIVSLVGTIIYSVIILYITLFSRSSTNNEVCLIPLYTVFTAKENSENFRTLIMNLLLFLPIGMLFPAAIHKRVNHIFSLTLLYGFVLSSCIEFLQYAFSIGKCEIDDVIMNVIGVMVGWLSHCLFDAILRRSRNAIISK